jgi:hypothetical protein
VTKRSGCERDTREPSLVRQWQERPCTQLCCAGPSLSEGSWERRKSSWVPLAVWNQRCGSSSGATRARLHGRTVKESSASKEVDSTPGRGRHLCADEHSGDESGIGCAHTAAYGGVLKSSALLGSRHCARIGAGAAAVPRYARARVDVTARRTRNAPHSVGQEEASDRRWHA